MPFWSKIALDIIEDVRGSVAMFMFIIEEAIQTIGMACYLAMKKQQYDKVIEYANFAINELINPAIDFANSYGNFAYPLHFAYLAFYESAKKTFQNYIDLANQAIAEQ
jgi:hypothetical protein